MKEIGIVGTFDVANYGDLLFPLLAQKRLEMLPVRISAVSPAGGDPIWSDCMPSRRLNDLAAFDGLLIGGGNIIRMSAATLDQYQVDATSIAGYPLLWASTPNAAASGQAVCWNAPGVPEPFPEFQLPLTRAALEAAAYLSVRDEESRGLLLSAWPKADIKVVPDTAWDIGMLWRPDELDDAYRRLIEGRAEQTIAVHLNERYLGMPDDAVASCMDAISEETGRKIVLLALGPCHDDDKLACRIAKRMQSKPIVIDKPSSLRTVAACISRSSAYLGSSMHGFITAVAFGVPAINVASQKVLKFAGLQHLFPGETICVDTWNEARAWVSANLGRDDHFVTQKHGISQSLNGHWDRVSAAFSGEKCPRAKKNDDLHSEIVAATLRDLTQRYIALQRRIKTLQTSKSRANRQVGGV